MTSDREEKSAIALRYPLDQARLTAAIKSIGWKLKRIAKEEAAAEPRATPLASKKKFLPCLQERRI